MSNQLSAEVLTARREYERGQIDNLTRLIDSTSDSLRLYVIAMPYLVGMVVLSFWIVLAAAWLDDVQAGDEGIKFIVVGMSLPIALVVAAAFVLMLLEIAHEWDRAHAIRERIRALDAFEPQEAEPAMPDFPPRWFIEFIRDHHIKTGRLPGIDTVNEHRRAQDNAFNREIAQGYYQSLVEWGAIEGREAHGKSAGQPVESWEWMLDHAT